MKPLFLLVAASLLAQEVTFKTETKLVIVNVSVKGKDGKPLTTLKKEDIEIYEDGVKQNLAVFELEQLSNDKLAPIDPAPAAPVTLVERAAPSAAAGQAVTTAANTAPVRHQDKRLVALFFDFSNMPQEDQIRARDAAVDFITKQMSTSDQVSIMAYGNRFDVLEDFTDDRDRLLSRLKKMATGEGSGLSESTSSADSTDDSGAFVADDSEFNVFNTDRKLSALEDATKKLAPYPEKKALIYFASGLTLTGLENQSQLRATVNAAVRANVSFYPVDARGLSAESPVGAASQASGRGTGVFTGATQSGRRSSAQGSQDTLYTLASDTGGKALVDSNDLALGIRQAQEDISSYYIVGYYSTNSNEDGKYRKIQVKLAGKDLQASKVDYRNGYYASKTFAKFTSSDKERQLEEALTLGDPVSELPLALEVDYFRVAQNRYLVPISVKIPGSVLALAKKGGKQSTDFDFIGQVREQPSGRLVTGVGDNIPVKFNDADASQLEHRNVQYDTGLTVPPGRYNLRFLARENQTGKMGTFETNFVVPDLSASKDLRLSSVILSSQKEAVTAAVGSASNDKRALANHPLIQNGQKTVPSITRVFRKDQTLYVYFEVYDPVADATTKAPSLSAQVDILQGARKALSSKPERQDKLTPNRPGVTSFNFQMPLSTLAAGQYTAQINVIDEAGKRFAFPRSAIVVLP